MFINYVHTKFHVHNSNGPLAIACKLKAKWKYFHTVVSHSTKHRFNKTYILFEHLLSYLISETFRSNLTSSCFFHVVITDCMEL